MTPWTISSVQFSHSVVSDSLRPHGLQHTRLPCPSPTPGACSNPCPSSQWCHPTILLGLEQSCDMICAQIPKSRLYLKPQTDRPFSLPDRYFLKNQTTSGSSSGSGKPICDRALSGWSLTHIADSNSRDNADTSNLFRSHCFIESFFLAIEALD